MGASTSNASESESDHEDDDGLTSALDDIISVFIEPPEAKGCDLSSIADEIDEIVKYARG